MSPSDAGTVSVCLCVDDFALNDGVNGAVQQLVAMERVHATGALVGAPAWQSGLGFLRRMHGQGLDVGLHLDFTEHPLTGRPRGLGALILQSYARQLDRAAVRAEIRAQLDTFDQGLGQAPSFVDGHQHVHQLPVIRNELLQELDLRYGERPPWIRCCRTRAAASAGAGVTGWLKTTVITALGSSALTSAARRQGQLQNGSLLGVYDFAGGASRYLMLLHGWLAAARDGDLLMCHPGLASSPDDPVGGAREAEFQVLASRQFGQLIREFGVQLRPMSRILAVSP